MLRVVERPGHQTTLRVPPSTRAVVSWNTSAASGGIALHVHRTDGTVSAPLLYARWTPGERRSLDGADDKTRIAVDIVRSDVPFTGITVATHAELDAVSVSVPPVGRAPAGPARVAPLDVPRLSQYLSAFPAERGWCSPTSLAMLLRYHGVDTDVPRTARAVYDASYEGTGNWAFNAAYAGACGLRAVVAYTRGLDHVARFVEAGMPVAISISWRPGELPGAPVEHSDGHLLVVRGVDRNWAYVNDPAAPQVAVRYGRAALDRIFRAQGGVAYLVAPRERTATIAAIANGTAPDAAGAAR